MERIVELSNLEKEKELFNQFLSKNYESNRFNSLGEQADRMLNTQKAVGVNVEYTVNTDNLIKVFDTKGAEWLNLQIIPETSWTSATLFIEWSNDYKVDSVWANALIDSEHISLTANPESIVLQIRGFSFMRLRFTGIPSGASALCKLRYI
ncbi:MAG: hypothetical protein CV045_02835 [Cyanobacteria bacterium M5B4]|nr:MAG: hypothetical protein CV045_02835 [Cyanobacteria bacterium M5B4]